LNDEYVRHACLLIGRKLRQLDLGEIQPYELQLTIAHHAGKPDAVTIARFEELRPTRAERDQARIDRRRLQAVNEEQLRA